MYNTYSMVAMGFMIDNHALTLGVVINHKSLAAVL